MVIISNIIFERDPYLASGDKVSILAGMESPSSRSKVQSRLLSSRTQNTQGRLGDHLAHLTPVVPHTRAGQDTRAVSTETMIDIYSKTQLQETHQDTRATVKYSFREYNRQTNAEFIDKITTKTCTLLIIYRVLMIYIQIPYNFVIYMNMSQYVDMRWIIYQNVLIYMYNTKILQICISLQC